MKITRILILLILTSSSLCYGQKTIKTIFFYKPYTDSTETNHYKNTKIEFEYDIQYQNIKTADIYCEVENAIRNNDFRIIALSGNSYVYPGLDGGYQTNLDGSKAFIGLSSVYKPHYNKFGFKVIKGTSDSINPENLPLQRIAYYFAKEYNRILFETMEQ